MLTMADDGCFIKSLFRKQSTINVLAMLVSTVGPIVCTALAGVHFGSEGLAIVAICAPLFLAASFLGSIVSYGAHIICSEFIAKDDEKGMNGAYSASVIVTLALDILVCAALLILRVPIFTLMGADITPELLAYYTFFVICAFFYMLVYIPLFFARCVGRAEIGLWMTGLLSAVSVVASLILVRLMGIEAIALGQAIGVAVGLAVALVMISRHFKFRFTKVLFIKPIFKYGSPEGLSRLYIMLATLILNMLFLRTGGSAALAVFGVVFSLHRFNSAWKFTLLSLGWNTAAGMLFCALRALLLRLKRSGINMPILIVKME